MFAVRNNRMCTKDCLCIHVCPTGATDTEDGQIDRTKCIGCGVCARSCPASAISMASEKDRIPEQQPNDKSVIETLIELAASKVKQEEISHQLKQSSNQTFLPFAKALEQSNRIMAEELFGEAGFMIPQNKNVHMLLQSLLVGTPSDFPTSVVEELLLSFKA